MKIERINENQIKIILNRADLAARNLDINELAYSNEKMQTLFREMMEQALVEHSFKPEGNSSLMIEAAMLSSDSIMIIVTKVTNGEDRGSEILNLIPRSKEERMFRKRTVADVSTPQETRDEGLTIYSFTGLDDVTNASKRLVGRLSPKNSLYKIMDKYYIVIHGDNAEHHISEDALDNILSEYGSKQPCSLIFESYLKEHGEVFLEMNAIAKLSRV